MKNKITVILVNLGSPDSYEIKDVRRYLSEFLADSRVIKLSKWIWNPILHGVVLQKRPPKTAEAYKLIWTEDGSPLLSISKQQTEKLVERFGTSVEIKLAMRYGNPSIKSIFQEINETDKAEQIDSSNHKVLIFPLYPQYSGTTVATIMDKVAESLKNVPSIPELRFINSYYREEQYITALANSVRTFWETYEKPEKLIFSYHGLPVKYVDDGDVYYEHCKQTTLLVAENLGLSDSEFMMTFQSRFGLQEWLKPYTDFTLKELAQNGMKAIHIISPSFSADCLETLEELEVLNCGYFKENGGETYHYIPALNECEQHIDLLESVIRKNIAGW